MEEAELEALIERTSPRAVAFEQLMPTRVLSILLVSSLYDSYTLREHGDLAEALLREFQALDMSAAPRIVRVSTAEQALSRLQSERFELVITTLRIGAVSLARFRDEISHISRDLPMLVLAYSTRELARLPATIERFDLDKPFVWLGDVGVLMAMTKYVEDRLNVRHDTWLADVQSIILIEDSVRFYSAFMPMLYRELARQNQRIMADGLNHAQRALRRGARTKVLLATSFDEALELYESFEANVLGIITDVRFPRQGHVDPCAGLDFVRLIRQSKPELPVLVMSSDADNRATAWVLNASFADKRSPDLLHQLRDFLLHSLGFGDFAFKLPDGATVAAARDLHGFLRALREIPVESLLYHASRNHFSTWLMARCEVELAKAMRARTVEEFATPEDLRQLLIQQIEATRRSRQQGVVADFSADHFDTDSGFVRTGGGSMGGKGRGLAFIRSLVDSPDFGARFPSVRFFVPPTVVIGTDAFERFMDDPALTALALGDADDEALVDAFLARALPDDVAQILRTLVDHLRYPLAVRSSSLLEDAYYQPFSGVYRTCMLANDDPDAELRFRALADAVKRVYASTYSADAKAYVASTQWRIEEEKMGIVIQQLVGRRHEDAFYPDIGGVGRSVDFYPMADADGSEGVVCLALGLGRTVAEGGRCVRFSPARPKRLYQFATTSSALDSAQRSFYALSLRDGGEVVSLGLQDAQRHGTLKAVASSYSADNDRITPGIGRKGVPLVTMAGVLSGRTIPLAEATRCVLDIGHAAFNGPAEIEFAVILGAGTAADPHGFALLQIRPIVFETDSAPVHVGSVRATDALVMTDKALGHGRFDDIRDIVYVPPQTFARAHTADVATEVGVINKALLRQQRPFMLIGPGRWGTHDRWLGIPVRWSQINGARCIVETDMADIAVTPSQGSHFFHNMTSLGIPYLTVDLGGAAGHVDFAWLDAQPAVTELRFVRHVSLASPATVLVDARTHRGVVSKPGVTPPAGREI